jgi:hypothetical protein
MGRLVYFLGGAALGLLAPAVVSLAREFYEANLRETFKRDIENEVETAAAAPDAIIVPINDETSASGESSASPPDSGPAGSPA